MVNSTRPELGTECPVRASGEMRAQTHANMSRTQTCTCMLLQTPLDAAAAAGRPGCPRRRAASRRRAQAAPPPIIGLQQGAPPLGSARLAGQPGNCRPEAGSGVMDLTTLVSGHLRYFQVSLGSPLIGIQFNRNYGRRSGAWARNGS